MSEILVATHGSANADGAVRIASQLARRLNRRLKALAVIELGEVIDYGFGAVVVPPIPEEELRDAVLAQLRRCGAERAAIDIASGDGAIEIAAAARRSGAAVIVTGIGPHTVIDRAVGGETVLELLTQATVPVLAVPAGATKLPRIVVAATDFTPGSLRAAQTAAAWLTSGDELHLIHVEPPRLAFGGNHPANFSTDAGTARIHAAVEAMAVAPGVRVEAVSLFGDAAKVVLEYSVACGADLAALGSHGYGAWKRLAYGSVAFSVLRHSSVSVLVAPIGCAARAEHYGVMAGRTGGE